MGKKVLVDDTDERIQYNGIGWKPLFSPFGDTTNEYNQTLHYSRNPGSTMTYTFNGTRITVLGTFVSPLTLPASTYSIDEGTPSFINSTGDMPHFGSTTKWPLAHVPFYTSPILPHGQHTLHVSVDVAVNQTYFFDYLIIEVDDDAANMGAVAVDDRDPAVVYTGLWDHSTPWLLEYDTTSSRANVGQNLTASYSFIGSAIAVYGTIQGDYGPLPIMSCTLDPSREPASSDAQVFTRTDVFSVSGSVTQHKHHRLCLFEDLQDIPGKNRGEHEIVLSSLPEALSPWRFDNFVYLPVGSTLRFNSSASNPVVTGNSMEVTFGPLTTNSTHQPQSEKTNTPSIIAGVVVGIAIIALLGTIVLWCRWKKRRVLTHGKGNGKLNGLGHYAPVVKLRQGGDRMDAAVVLPLKYRNGHHDSQGQTGTVDGVRSTLLSSSSIHNSPSADSAGPTLRTSHITRLHIDTLEGPASSHPTSASGEQEESRRAPRFTGSIIQRTRYSVSSSAAGQEWIQEVDGGVRLEPCDEDDDPRPVLLPPRYSDYR